MEQTLLIIVLAPLIAAIIAGFFGRWIGRVATHSVTIAGVAISCGLSAKVLLRPAATARPRSTDRSTPGWSATASRCRSGSWSTGSRRLMMLVVTFVSLMVHIYTIGYMHDDPGYTRFFSYISLFTFSMLMLVMANNLVQLFFGWEAVGVVSYLLIGFWYTRPSAIFANLKAFLVNRVGDFGFLLGIAGIVYLTGSVHYSEIFAQADRIAGSTFELIPGQTWQAATVICICLFIGAMGKSAQVPLHVWLPDSMEGPTPISALIHAATMVTAGIFMVDRMSPLFELSETALSFVLVIGATTALFMGLLGVVNNDIKRVVAYSTLSQLGYMTVALGVSAYAGAFFHLMTHAFFKALLFLAAGSVIIAMHHEQDMRKMGGLKKYMPITYWTALIGTLALIGFPGFSGFFSKDALIEAVHASHIPGAGYAYFCVMVGVFVTAFYSFRLVFLTFHGEERMDAHTREHLHESPWVVTLPLVLLAIPSVVIGWLTIKPLLFGGYFGSAIRWPSSTTCSASSAKSSTGRRSSCCTASWARRCGWRRRAWCWPGSCTSSGRICPRGCGEGRRCSTRLLENKYYFDWFNEKVIAAGSRALGTRAVEGRRRGPDRRRGGQRLGPAGGLGGQPRRAACSRATSITTPSRRSSDSRCCSRGSSGEADVTRTCNSTGPS